MAPSIPDRRPQIDAAIRLPDGSIDAMVTEIVRTGPANRGQFCAGIKRVYVPHDKYDAVCDRLTAAAEAIRLSDGFEANAQMTPIQNKAQLDLLIPMPLIKASGVGIGYADHGVRRTMRMQVIDVRKAA